MSVYAKLNQARKLFHSKELKKSGKNSFANYAYFELSDFVIPALEIFEEVGLCGVISFTDGLASMVIRETDGDGMIEITSPMREANLKGCHPIQNLGAVETYQRRYLWMAALEIVEHDEIDSAQPVEGYTEEQKDKFHALLNGSDALAYLEFATTLPEGHLGELMKTLPDGKKVSGKQKSGQLQDEAHGTLDDYAAQIKEAVETDDISGMELVNELTPFEKKMVSVRLDQKHIDWIKANKEAK